MTYYDFFGIKPKFDIDKKALKLLFIENSKKYHPDFFTLENEEKKNEVMQLATLNNEAYKCLNNHESNMKYLLQLHQLDIGDKEIMPQSFLMEMMDINEQIMDLEIDFDPQEYKNVIQEVKDLENDIQSNLNEATNAYDTKSDETRLEIIKEFYLKNRYLLRIKESLYKFAPQVES